MSKVVVAADTRLHAWGLSALLLLSLLALGACNTIAGAGEDIEAAGEAVSETAEDVDNDM